jgi:hypothetical protein
MIILKIALGILAAGILEFLGLFLWCIFIDWKHKKKDTEDKTEV